MDIEKIIKGFFESNLNIAFCLIIMLIGVRSYIVHTVPLIKTSKELKNILGIISIKNEPNAIIEELEKGTYEYDGFEIYVKEFCDSWKTKIVDIDKYFNVVNIIEIPSKRKMAELVPGILTALGILGTFLGLLIGLSELNTSSNENLTSSVGTVINGMTLAFWTSIVGILSSLIWNQIDKNILVKVRRNLHQVRNKLFEITGSKTTEDLLAKIESYQMEQTLALNNMGSDFAQILQDVLVPSIESGFSKAIDESLSPLLERIENIVVNFSEKISENQTDGLERIVENFIGSMNQSMSGQFENLSKTIEELCEWQKQTKEDLDILIIEMKRASSDQMIINQQTDRIISNISQYSDKLISGSEKLYVQVNAFEKIANHVSEVIIINQNVFNDVNEKSKVIEDTTQKSVKNISEIADKLQLVWSTSREQLDSSSKIFNDSSQEFRESLQSGLISTFESFDTNISQFVGHFNGNIENIKDTVFDLSKIVVETNKQLKESIIILENSIKSIPREVKVIVDKNTN